MAFQSRVITMSPLVIDGESDLDLDLDLWEVIDPSDAQYSDDSFSVDSLSDDDVISLDDDASSDSLPVISLPQMLPSVEGCDRATDLDIDGHIDGDCDDGVGDGVDDSDLRWSLRWMVLLGDDSRYSRGNTYGDYANRGGSYNEGDEDLGGLDGEDDDAYDLDDELIPRSVSAKLGRQRMRKLGKRALAKVLTSKTSPYSHLKPGCVRGKYGLGMKFRC